MSVLKWKENSKNIEAFFLFYNSCNYRNYKIELSLYAIAISFKYRDLNYSTIFFTTMEILRKQIICVCVCEREKERDCSCE